MREGLRALRAVVTELFLAVTFQPRAGQTPADRARHLHKTRRVRTGERAGPLAALRTLGREALCAVFGQPSPEAGSEKRSVSSRRKPRS